MITHNSKNNDMFDDVIKIPSRRNWQWTIDLTITFGSAK
jgi:hypothetical protein